ncbi:MAG: hypothetical protein KGJ47_00175 [Acidobacteriota bacterium]|nr:hypothetical protein [Acidobacteriota bacterium]MDE3092187.1 hypothetical protein [Acidobacteriota bacterium]
MSIDGENDEAFDEEELAEGFDEEILSDDIDDADDLDGEVAELDDESSNDDDDDSDDEVDEDAPVLLAVAEDEDDLSDDADVELALDEVLAETIRRTTAPEDDDDGPLEIDPLVDPFETILPKQDDEFRCKSCRLLKKMSQLADPDKTLCRDCV